MPFKNLLTPERICIDTTAQSKKAALLRISKLLSNADPAITAEKLFDDFWQREALGSTAIGNGIILPHVRCEAIAKPYGCFLKLVYPVVDFGADDKQPVDLILGLLVPQGQAETHLKMLSDLVKRFSDVSFLQQCRSIHSEEQLALWLLKSNTSVSEKQLECTEG